MKARRAFPERVSAKKLKNELGVKCCGHRQSVLNKNQLHAYPRCRNINKGRHVIKCPNLEEDRGEW